jgi:hypothetical protein
MAIVFNIKTKRKQRRKFNILRFLKLLLVITIATMAYSFGVAVYENTQANRVIEAFKARANGLYTEEVVLYGSIEQVRRYYQVSRETSYEINDSRSVFQSEDKLFLGQKGDIFLTHDSPFPYIPLVHQFISYYSGGHAAIHNGNGAFIEATGFPDDDESVLDIILHPGGDEPHDFSVTVAQTQSNYWLRPTFRNSSDKAYDYFGTYYRNDFVGVRVKDVTLDQIDGAVLYAEDKVGKALYNFTIFFDTKYTFYCTDLVSRAYQAVLVDEDKQSSYSRALNDDQFVTSVNDIILSKETYIIFYVEIIDEIVHIYHLED